MKTTLAVLIVVIVIIGLVAIFNGKSKQAPTDTASSTLEASSTDTMNPGGAASTTDDAAAAAEAMTPTAAVVTYTATGFSPSTLTVAPGTTVTFKNESGHGMWVASGVHPTHAAYDGTTLNEHCNPANGETPFDECGTGDEYSFTFDKAGTWHYHNHVQSGDTGTIVVQ